MIYVKINDMQYPASITGKIHDSDWDNRESKAIELEMSYSNAINTFVNNAQWYIVQEVEEVVENIIEETIERTDEETGEIITETIEKPIFQTIIKQEFYDNSEYSLAGDIIDHRNGKVTVKMGKPTETEQLQAVVDELLLEVLA